MDLSPFILKPQCECLNENDEHPLTAALAAGGGFLQSDCDEQVTNLIFSWIKINVFVIVNHFHYI